MHYLLYLINLDYTWLHDYVYWLYYHIADVYLFLLPVAAAGEDL